MHSFGYFFIIGDLKIIMSSSNTTKQKSIHGLCAGILAYGDPDGLDRCLKSLNLGNANDNGNNHGIDIAIIIHAKFPNFDPDNDMPVRESLDSISQVIRKYPADNIYFYNTPGQNTTEIEARNLYLERAVDLGCDWLLVIDTDEYVAPNADWKLFREALEFETSLQLKSQIYDVMFEGAISERGPRPRLFHNTDTIKYWGKHYWLVLEAQGKKLLKGVGDAGKQVGGIYILHDRTIRDAKYFKASYLYKQWQQTYEGAPS